jgi:hypothetical protein
MNISRIVIISLVICAVCSCQSSAQNVSVDNKVVEIINSNISNQIGELQTYTQEENTLVTSVELENTTSQNNDFNLDLLEKGLSNRSIDSVDLLTGNSPSTPNSYLNFFEREKVITLTINETRYNDEYAKDGIREIQRINRYENELLISSYYSLHDIDPNELYDYDSLGRRIKSGRDFTYSYSENNIPNERERTVYLRGKYHSTEIIRVTENGYEVYTRRSDGSEASRKFIYENGLLMHIISGYPKEGYEWNWVDFTYENALLNDIVVATSKKDDIRSITKVLAYDGNNMLEMEQHRFFQQGTVEVLEHWKFMNYDEHGNWHDAECYSNDGILTMKYHRDIEYN